MADFLESEAEESEGGSEDEVQAPVLQKQKKRKQALESDEEEEEDDGEEVHDLIDDNPIEEDSDNESQGSRKRKKSDDEDEDELDDRLEDEDYELLEENLGVKVQRKFKRLKRIEDEDSDEEEAQDRTDDREAIANQLFEVSDNEEERASHRDDATGQYASEESEGEYSETDDFIVDDEGRPLTEKRRKKKPTFADSTLQEAQDIFGVDFDYDEFEKYDEEYYEEEEEEDEYEDEEGRTQRRAKKVPRKKKKQKSIYEIYEPSELERAGFTDEDNRIRNLDVPERMQLRAVPVLPATEIELDEEAEWIFEIAFSKRALLGGMRVNGANSGKGGANWDDWDDNPREGLESTRQMDAPIPMDIDTRSQAQKNPVNEDWDEDWEDNNTGQRPPEKTTTREEPVLRQPPPPQSTAGNADWDENWDEGPAERPPEKIAEPPVVQRPPAPPKSGVDEDWEEDWEAEQPDQASKETAEPVAESEKLPDIESMRVADDEDWDESPTPGGGNSSPSPNDDADDKPEEDKSPEGVKSRMIPKIKKALEFMRNQHLEVPFIAFYKKEYVLPELNINDLWTIYRLDARYCQLRTRKMRLFVLFKNMQDYQTDLIMEKPDEPLGDHIRLITEDDLERIKLIRNQEELKDTYLHFSLYYAQDVQPMKDKMRKKKAEKAQRARELLMASGEGEDGEVEVPKELEEEPMDESDLQLDNGPIIKRKVGGGTYGLCLKMGLDGLAKKFGLAPERFAENLRDNYQRHEVEQYPVEPLETAKEYINPRLPTEDDVLKAVKFMVSTQLSREPLVRQSVREAIYDRATLTVFPTKKGLKEIDEGSVIYTMKYLRDKPVRDLREDQFLKLSVAEDDGLITIQLADDMKGITSASYVEEVKQLYHKDEFSKNVQDWNNLRGECVEFALEKLLFPVIRKELKAKLLTEAKEFILQTAATKLNEWLKVAPYVVSFPDEEEEEWDTAKGLKVLSIAYVPDLSQAAFACLVSPDGDPSDYLRLQNIIKYTKAFRESDRLEKEADLLALKNFIRQKKPHIVVIGGESRDAIMIQDDVRNIISELQGLDSFPNIAVEILENQLAKVYANSIKAQNDFREYPLLLRQAISLGRRMQDPLIEFSQLCTADEEILCLRLHPLQDHVEKEDLLEYLQTEFINQTNEVGIDVNQAIAYPYTANLVQFVCGLGPRKAAALIKTLKQNNQRLENRTQLITVCHMGPKIFINCSGFIKIDTNSLGDSTEAYVEVLDGSRVHPETYEWARKMAVDALEYDDEDANPAGALEEILEAPERLKDLDLDAFAEELGRQGFGNKSITLYDIRAELNHRYKDTRTPYQTPTPEELFNMLTGETPETLYLGKLVTASVVGISHKKPQGEQLDKAVPVRDEATGMWQCAFCMKNDFPDLSEVWNHFDSGACPGLAIGVRIRLDNGISGFIPISKLSDREVIKPEDRVRRGQSIHCRVNKITVEKFSVECTSKTSDLVDASNEWRQSKDPYYDHPSEEQDLKKDEEAKKLRQRQTYIKRVIVHPSFKNISYRESEKLMEQMDQGEVIVRPSSKGADHLTVTWKVADGIYQHIDVREEGKENAFSLGQSLWINNEEFEDLDEIIARHVNPMASFARDLINFKYYKHIEDGKRELAEEYLKEEWKKSANKIHYILFAAKDYPGKFVLSYLPKNRVCHEFITVIPEGFRFRQQAFDSLNSLFKWFKEHYRDPPPSATPSIVTPRSIHPAARTPFATPGYNDAASRIGGGAPSQFGGVSIAGTHTTPYATPGQAYTPFTAFNSHTPYTPTAQTPNMTPFQPTTPKISSTQSVVGASGFLHPGGVTPGYKTPQQQRSSQQQQQQRMVPRNPSNGNPSSDSLDWRKAAEAWAKSQTKGPAVPGRPGGVDGGASSSRSQVGIGTRTAAQIISEGIDKTKKMSSAHNFLPSYKSPKSGRDSLRSTPRTNFSPRSMVESSLGDETPLYDEN